MLHVTNGDVVAEKLAQAEIPGSYLSWQDVLHEGPVPVVSDEELRSVRARYLAACGWTTYEAALAGLEARDRALFEAEEVLLWFEDDLFDQLQLIQVLERIARTEKQAWLICIGSFPGRPGFAGLGELEVAELASLHGTEQEVTGEQGARAQHVWAAFRAADPGDLIRLAHEESAALPFLGAALVRHLQQFPSVEDGLSRVERDILELAAERARTPVELFRAQAGREERPFLGDSIFFDYLRGLAGGAVPLAEPRGEAFAPTEAGAEVLAGTADAVALNGIDRWLGGVHLEGEAPWRWSREARDLVPMA